MQIDKATTFNRKSGEMWEFTELNQQLSGEQTGLIKQSFPNASPIPVGCAR